MNKEIVDQAVGFISSMKAGQIRVFPFRLSSEERDIVKNRLRRGGLRQIGFGINPTSEGGGTTIYRPDRVNGRR